MLLLMQRTGSQLDIRKLSSELGIARQTLNDYIAFLESTYFIKTIRPFSKGKDGELRKMPKVYICDTGLANHFARLDAGALFENSIFQNLRLQGELNYYQKKSGVDMVFSYLTAPAIPYIRNKTPRGSNIRAMIFFRLLCSISAAAEPKRP